MSRLRRWADGVLEASWLMVVAVTPIFFSVHTGVGAFAFGFEASKALLVRVLALVMAAAWITRSFEGGADDAPGRPLWRTPMLVPLLLYVGAFVASTFVSLSPSTSFWGASARLDGVLTLAAYLVVFASVAARLRRPAAVGRLLDVIVVTSVPVCLYSVMQAKGVDPAPWVDTLFASEGRAFSMLGNPIFAGAYLVLILPLTLASGLRSWKAAGQLPRALVCGVAFVLQLVALALTSSRGPWIAAVAGLFTFGVLAGAARRRRLWTAIAFAPAVAFGLFVLVLNVPRGPLEPLREKPSLRRLAHLFDKATPDLSGRSRFLIWKSALELVLPRRPLLDTAGQPDRLRLLRPPLGYGMESFSLAFPAVYDVEFARIERRHHLQSEEPLEKQEEPPPLADRNHNEFWDSVVFAGWVGGVAHVLFYGSILALILEVLGLDTGSRRWRFTGFLGVGGLLAGLAVSDAFGWPYLGVALPFGLVGAFIVHAILATFRGRTPDPGPVPWVALGLGAALVGNLVEVHLGLAVTTGKLYFWVLLGMLAAAFHERGALDGAAEPEEGADGASSAWLRIGLMGAAFLVTLLFDFVRASGGAVDEKRATGQQLLFGIGLLVLGLLLLLWWRKAGRAWLGPVLALGVALLFGAVQLQTVSVAGDLKNDLPTMESFARWLLPQYVFVVTALAIGLGIAIAGARRAEALSSRGRLGVAVAAASLFAAALLAWPLALYKSEAESLVKIASVFERSSRFPVAAALYQRATEIDPREARYALYVGKVALKASRAPQPPADVQRWMDMGAQAFERARELSPWDPGHVLNLARLDIRRSELVIPGQDQPYAQRADEEYQRALRMSPNNVVLLNEYALFQLLRRGAIPEAEKNLQKSLEMEPGYFFTYTALGQLYVTRGQRGMGDKLENYKKAIDYYDRSLNMQNSARTAVSLGLLSLEVEDKPTSVARLERALTLGPAPEAARKVHAHLAQLYAALGQPDRAAAHAALSRASS